LKSDGHQLSMFPVRWKLSLSLTFPSLQNYFITCDFSEKLVQLARIIQLEASEKQSSHFIVYFATCACVDYFYKVSCFASPFKPDI